MTTGADVTSLAVALARLGPPGIAIGHRVISEGDENALLPIETLALRTSALRVRRQSGAARIVARRLLSTFNIHDAALPRSELAAPAWPSGFVGSLAHDAAIAIAAVASTKYFRALGVDIEPAEPLPPELVKTVTSPLELEQYPAAVVESRLLFVIKEAIYKATNPIDGEFLNFHDIRVDLNTNEASIRSVRRINFAACVKPRVVALAFVKAS